MVAVATQQDVQSKMLLGLQEVKARRATVIAVAYEDDEEIGWSPTMSCASRAPPTPSPRSWPPSPSSCSPTTRPSGSAATSTNAGTWPRALLWSSGWWSAVGGQSTTGAVLGGQRGVTPRFLDAGGWE